MDIGETCGTIILIPPIITMGGSPREEGKRRNSNLFMRTVLYHYKLEVRISRFVKERATHSLDDIIITDSLANGISVHREKLKFKLNFDDSVRLKYSVTRFSPAGDILQVYQNVVTVNFDTLCLFGEPKIIMLRVRDEYYKKEHKYYTDLIPAPFGLIYEASPRTYTTITFREPNLCRFLTLKDEYVRDEVSRYLNPEKFTQESFTYRSAAFFDQESTINRATREKFLGLENWQFTIQFPDGTSILYTVDHQGKEKSERVSLDVTPEIIPYSSLFVDDSNGKFKLLGPCFRNLLVEVENVALMKTRNFYLHIEYLVHGSEIVISDTLLRPIV